MRRDRRQKPPRYLLPTFSSLVFSTDMYRSAQLMQRPPIHVMAFSSRQYLLTASGRSKSNRLHPSKRKHINTSYPYLVSFSSISNNIEHNSDIHQSKQDRVCVMMPSDKNDAFRNKAQDVANHLALPLFIQSPNIADETGWNASYRHCLSLEPYHFLDIETYALSIQPFSGTFEDNCENAKGKKRRRTKPNTKNTIKPFFIDFCPDSGTKMGKRLSGGQKGGEMLLKATALGRNKESSVIDFTAGLGQDSCIMALGGASSVHMIEQDPIVAALLHDAFRRMELIANTSIGEKEQNVVVARAQELQSKLTFEQGSAIDVARRVMAQPSDQNNRPDICYLDPMFPPRTKSAAVKKNMNILHGLLETQTIENDEERERNEADLLLAALEVAQKKVIVKRPVQAPPLGGEYVVKRKPSSIIKGSVNRWDIYVV